MRDISRTMRQTALCSLLPLSLLLCPLAASADPARLNNPAPPPVAPVAPAAPPPSSYDAPPPVAGYNPPPPVAGYNQPPPVVQARPQPVMMSQQPMLLRQPAPPPPTGRQGLFVGVQGGAAIPLSGDYANFFGAGFMGLGHIGWATLSGISVRAELGVRSNAPSDPTLDATTLTSVFYGAGLRWTGPRATLRPYAEVLIDAFSSVTQTVDTTSATTSTSSGTGISVGGALGAELELSDTFSLELAVRYDHVVANGETGPKGGLLGVLGGGTFYF
jgi:hypothetical protein